MKPQTPKMKPQTPAKKNGTPAKTPKKTPKPQADTPMPPKQTPKASPKAQQTPKQQKQKTQQQQKQINPPTPKQQHKSPKEDQAKKQGPGAKASRDNQARTVRLTFPAGTLQSVEQVKKFVPTATAIKFPNVVFVEFASESEADKQHSKLQPLIADGQLNQINFVGEKEREFQSNNRGVDNTRLFVRGIGSATEADIKKLFPTSTAVVVRGTTQARGKSHQHKYCFVVFATAAACTEALEKSKGLTLFGNPLTVNYAFLRKGPGGEEAKAEKRPAETAAPATTKKIKVEQPKVEEEEDDDDDEDDEDDEEEDEDDDDDEDDDEEGEDEEDGDEDDDDDDEDDDDDDDEDDDDDDDDEE